MTSKREVVRYFVSGFWLSVIGLLCAAPVLIYLSWATSHLNPFRREPGAREQRYIAADLGSSFGKAGETMFYTKGKLKDFQSLPLIKNAGPEYIDFWRFTHIPREHAKWITGYLAQLSDQQIRDAFRAAQFSPEEVEGFSKKVREKINELQQL